MFGPTLEEVYVVYEDSIGPFGPVSDVIAVVGTANAAHDIASYKYRPSGSQRRWNVLSIDVSVIERLAKYLTPQQNEDEP